jgi:hypothetical protein
MNYSLSVEELNYARNKAVFANVKSNTQIRYLQFCIRYFKYFGLYALDPESNLLVGALQAESEIRQRSKTDFNNSFALSYTRSPPTPLPRGSNDNNKGSASLSSKKHLRNASSISTALLGSQPLKRVKL